MTPANSAVAPKPSRVSTSRAGTIGSKPVAAPEMFASVGVGVVSGAGVVTGVVAGVVVGVVPAAVPVPASVPSQAVAAAGSTVKLHVTVRAVVWTFTVYVPGASGLRGIATTALLPARICSRRAGGVRRRQRADLERAARTGDRC